MDSEVLTQFAGQLSRELNGRKKRQRHDGGLHRGSLLGTDLGGAVTRSRFWPQVVKALPVGSKEAAASATVHHYRAYRRSCRNTTGLLIALGLSAHTSP